MEKVTTSLFKKHKRFYLGCLLLMLILVLLYLFIPNGYNKIEKRAQRVSTDNCILGSIFFTVFAYYDEFNQYPDEEAD